MEVAAEPEGPHATIHVLRTGPPHDYCSPPFVEIDGRNLGLLDRGTYVTAYVPAGEHHVRIRSGTGNEGKRLRVEAGKTYFLRSRALARGYIPAFEYAQDGARLVLEYCRLGAVDLTKESGQGK